MHLIIDGFGTNIARLGDERIVKRFLDEHPEKICMTKISEPQVCTYKGPNAEDWGVSGFVLIAESHISVHTFPERGLLNIDIYSCKDFDTPQSVRDVKDWFALDDVRMFTIERAPEITVGEYPICDFRKLGGSLPYPRNIKSD